MDKTKIKTNKRKIANEQKLIDQNSANNKDVTEPLSTSLASNGSLISSYNEYDLDTSDEEVNFFQFFFYRNILVKN